MLTPERIASAVRVQFAFFEWSRRNVLRLSTELRSAREREAKLRDALRNLSIAASAFAADQSRATDKRCGLVQPVSVQECGELNAALANTFAALAAGDAEGK